MNDWEKVMLKARRKDKNERFNPYQYHALEYHYIYHFKELGLIRNKNVDVQREKVNWMKVKALRFSKYQTFIIFYKNDPAATEWKQINIRVTRSVRRTSILCRSKDIAQLLQESYSYL